MIEILITLTSPLPLTYNFVMIGLFKTKSSPSSDEMPPTSIAQPTEIEKQDANTNETSDIPGLLYKVFCL